MHELTMHDWVFLGSIVLLVATIGMAESAKVAGFGRSMGLAMLGSTAVLCSLLLTTDTSGSLFFGYFAESNDGGSGKPRKAKVAVVEEGGDGRAAGRDPSGPGDGEGGDGEIRLSLMTMPALDGEGGARPGAVPVAGSRGSAPPRSGKMVRLEMEGRDGDRPMDLEEVPGDPRAAKPERDCPQCPDMMLVPPGTLTLGPAEHEPGVKTADGGPRRITIAKPFLIGRFEITVSEFHAFVAATGYRSAVGCVIGGSWRFGYDYMPPGFKQSDNHPVVCVSWNDAKAYVAWLARTTGRRYRLPSENEWEYAARAGRRAAGEPFVTGATILASEANFALQRRSTRVVGKYKPNKLGLFDVAGNAWELVEDCFEPDARRLPRDAKAHVVQGCTRRVMRGGSWYNHPGYLRLAARWANPVGAAGNGVCFRVVCDLDVD